MKDLNQTSENIHLKPLHLSSCSRQEWDLVVLDLVAGGKVLDL